MKYRNSKDKTLNCWKIHVFGPNEIIGWTFNDIAQRQQQQHILLWVWKQEKLICGLDV